MESCKISGLGNAAPGTDAGDRCRAWFAIPPKINTELSAVDANSSAEVEGAKVG
ncbi:MAG: hypothetical protein R3C26_21490 [Calditrichia bacterium]|nr:hypothetical protein [Calditrichia bacterium]